MSRVRARVDAAAARAVAAAYLAAPWRGDRRAIAAFAQLVTESDRLFRWITSPDRPDPVRVAFTKNLPARFRLGLLSFSVVTDPDRRHPLMDSAVGGAYDRFRAVHDILGHARLGVGFDRHGEFTAWLHQERFHSPLARGALATELHGQHSVRWTTGEMAPPKGVLLEPGLLHRSRLRAGAAAATT